MTRHIYVAIPTIDGRLKWRTRIALVRASHEVRRLGWKISMCWLVGDSLISHARNTIISYFLASDCTDLVWIDSDMAWKPGTFTQLLSHDEAFVAGAYRSKKDDVHYNINFLPSTEVNENGLIEVAAAAFGFAALTRQAVEQMVERYQHSWYFPLYDQKTKCWDLFRTGVIDHVYWGEDYGFCRLWREMGGKVWLDPTIKLDHIGKRWKPYRGDIGAWLEAHDQRSNPQSPATGNGSPAIAAG